MRELAVDLVNFLRAFCELLIMIALVFDLSNFDAILNYFRFLIRNSVYCNFPPSLLYFVFFKVTNLCFVVHLIRCAFKKGLLGR